MTTDANQGPDEPKTLTYKEKAQAFRRDVYQKAKARHKERVAIQKSSPTGLAQAALQKAKRREAYLKAKESYKVRQGEKRRQEADAQRMMAAESKAQKMDELLKSLTPGDRMKPKLRLVKE